MIWRFAVIGSALAAAAALCGCMTERAHPQPSAAVLEARAARSASTAACDPIADAPVSASFAFQTAELSLVGQQRLDEAVKVLACHPSAVVVIEASADQRGTEAEQARLAQQRRAAVAAYLAQAGVPPGRIAAGSAAPAGGDGLVIRAEGQGW